MMTYAHGLPVGDSGHSCPVHCELCDTSLGLVSTASPRRGMTAAEVLLHWPHLYVEVHAHQICCPTRGTPRELKDGGGQDPPGPVAWLRWAG